jgi:hypothetical protein
MLALTQRDPMTEGHNTVLVSCDRFVNEEGFGYGSSASKIGNAVETCVASVERQLKGYNKCHKEAGHMLVDWMR